MKQITADSEPECTLNDGTIRGETHAGSVVVHEGPVRFLSGVGRNVIFLSPVP